MKRSLQALIVVLCLVSFDSTSSAILLHDTGIPTVIGLAGNVNAWTWRAGKFTIDEPGYNITDIEGYFASFPNAGGNFIMDIREEGAGFPSSSVLYSGTFFLPPSSTGGWEYGWYGLHGLTGWLLEPNHYWVVFRGDPDYDYPNYIQPGGMTYNAPNPLAAYAYSLHGVWGLESVSFGVRIAGEPVPEPATMLLLGSGLLGLAGLRRKFRRK